jgi:nucleotide-binding universal stress UspA family protein
MKKILCPIDFSDAAKNAVEYAANLSKALNESLTLLYVRQSIWPEAIQLEKEVMESNEELAARLLVFINEIQDEFGIPCHYHIAQTTGTMEEAVAEFAADFDLIVMGTNGADNYYQYAFGTNSFHVIEKSKCPVLVIPEDYSYRSINLIVYAYDPDTNPIFLIDQLKGLVTSLNANVKVLHILQEKPSEESKRKLAILKETVRVREPKHISWSFDSQFSHEVSFALNQYMKEHRGDILAMSFHHRTLMENLFTENTIKKISMMADYPVFVFWR